MAFTTERKAEPPLVWSRAVRTGEDVGLEASLVQVVWRVGHWWCSSHAMSGLEASERVARHLVHSLVVVYRPVEVLPKRDLRVPLFRQKIGGVGVGGVDRPLPVGTGDLNSSPVVRLGGARGVERRDCEGEGSSWSG